MEGLESHIRCEPCDQWFSSDADFRAHRAEKHQAEVSLRTSDGTVVKVTRNRVSQKFVCPGECGYSTNVPRNLQRHTRTCRATGGHMRAGNVGGSRVEGGGEKETIEIALGPRDRCKSTLLSTSSLAKVHMKVSSFLGRPICDLCGVALEIASCALHLRSVHGWSSLSLDVDAEVLSILKERGMDIDAERLPAPNLEIREAVEGLRLYRGAWKCLLCEKRGTGYFVPQRESMIRHLRKEHSESMEARKPSESLMVECAAIQSVFGGPRRKYFQVFPPKCLEDREDEETVTEIVKELTLSNSQLSSSSNLHPKEAPQASPSVEERQKEDEDDEPENVIDSILTQTRWHKIILNFPTDKIKLYIAGCAQRNEFEKNVSELVCTYLKIGTTRLQFNTSLHLRRKLLGEKSTSYRYFSGLQTSKSLQQYSDLACRLILMCMRRAGGITQEGKVCEFEEFPALPDEVALSALRLRKEADSSFKSRELFETSVSEIDDALCGCVFETGEQVLNRRMFLLHEILRSIFCVKFPLSEKRENMIVHQFLAFISKLDDERFIRAEELPPIISRLQYVCRVTVMFQIALEDARGSETDQALSWLSYVSSEEITPFVELCEVYGLATNITNSKGALPEIVWDTSCPDGTQLFVQGLTVSVKSLSELLKSILEQAERILYNGILMGSRDAKRSIDSRIEALKLSLLEGKFLDDLRCERQGYYFGDDIRNRGIFADLSECFLRNILLHRNRRQDFFNVEWEDDKKTVSWSTRRLMVFLELCEKLIEILIPIFQIMSGQPARCTELATTQIRNDDTSRRTLMLVNRRVVNILSYSKTRSITGRPRLVPRFLDSRASSLLLVYLTVVRPVETFFVRRLLGDERANGHAAYLFSTVNGRMGGKEIARSFEKVMRSTWLPLTSRMYRHVCTAFTRELLKGKSLRNQVWLPYDEQAAHTAETAEFRYGRSISDHRCVTSHELVAYHAASVSWQKLLGFSTDESLSISEYRRENLGEIQEGAQLKPSSREAFHSSMVIERALQRVDEGLLSLQRDMQFLKESDGVFKKSRQIESAEGDDRSDPTRFGSSELQRPQKPDTRAVDARKYAVKTVRSFSRGISVPSSDWSQSPTLERTLLYRKYLQDMLNDVNAEFKSREQLLAIHESHSRNRDVLAVLPTGGGKSMLFLVPSALEKDLITVVVCPLVALSNDMKNRFARFGIRFAAWSERHNDDFQILIVSIETASTNDFLDFLNQLALRSVLARIVIDEAHIILTSAEYRPKLKELISMRPSAPVPLLLLTASLPPSMTQELCRAVGSRNTLIIRSPSTIRSNIKYSIRQGSKIGTTARFRTIVAILKHHIAQFGNDDRAIIYCHTKFATEILAKNLSDEGRELKARPYHSESCQKELLDKSWRFGLARVMVATGAFGAGIDYPHVRLVIHDGNPRTILDFAQESGRAGRDGRKAESIVLLQPPSTSLHARGRRSIGPMTEEEDPRVRKWIAECTRGSCIRQSLHMHLDGCAVPCIGQPKGEVQLCAACEKAVRKNKRAFDESLNEEYLNTKCRKMSISSSLALESARADAERRKITEALRKFNEVCALLKQRECPHCMGANAARCNTPSLLHSQGRCPYLRQRCLRCYSTSHSSSSQCPSPPFSFPERGGKCYQCGFRKEYFGVTIHEKDRFGRQCSSNAKFAREVLLSMWAYQKRLLAKEISEFELLSGDIMKYQEWLYDVQSAPPNIVILFNKLYACESKSEVPQ